MRKFVLLIIFGIIFSLYLYEPDFPVLCSKIRDFAVSMYNKFTPQTDIDIVYTWVDGNDPEWQKEKDKYINTVGKSSPAKDKCRYIDNQELKYALRSAYKNIPWIHKIYIVTNGQIPNWLDTSNPKIKIITHSQIMPKSALPTFNSEAIEANLYKIPNLSEYFLYSNDDFFIGRPVTPRYFFTKDKKPIIELKNVKIDSNTTCLYFINVQYSAKLIEGKYGISYDNHLENHNVTPYRKSHYEHCAKEFKKDFDKTTHYKFRTKHSVQRSIVSFYALSQGEGVLSSTAGSLHMELLSPSTLQQSLRNFRPYLFCINDNEEATDENRANLKYLLEKLFPNKAPWEK